MPKTKFRHIEISEAIYRRICKPVHGGRTPLFAYFGYTSPSDFVREASRSLVNSLEEKLDMESIGKSERV